MLMSMTERERKVQEKAMRIFKKYKCYCYKNAQNMFTEAGRPDVAACVPVTVKQLLDLYGEDAEVGIFVGVELKRDGKLGNVSTAQQIVGRAIKRAKGIWLAVDDANIIEALLVKLQGEIL